MTPTAIAGLQNGPRLSIDLVPATAWGENLRTLFATPTVFKRVKAWTHERAGQRCEACGRIKGGERGQTKTLECHEQWSYDDGAGVQRLESTVSLCRMCHMCCHFGLSQLQGREPQVRAWLRRVNAWSERQLQDHIAESFETWNRRSAMEWRTDVVAFFRSLELAGVSTQAFLAPTPRHTFSSLPVQA